MRERYYTCIYCTKEKPASEFNTEHVIPKQLGKFGPETPVLLKEVCKVCNSAFGDSVERSFGRDSFYGILRIRYGLIGAKDYKREYEHSETFIYSEELGTKVIADFVDFETSTFLCRPAEQFMVFNSTKGRRAALRPIMKPGLPFNRYLEKLGLCPKLSYFTAVIYPDALPSMLMQRSLECLAGKQWGKVLKAKGEPTYFNNSINKNLSVKSIFDSELILVFAKIAFNYFAYEFSSLILDEGFNDLRSCFLFRNNHIFGLVTVSNEKILSSRFPQKIGHVLGVHQDSKNNVFCEISLFNQCTIKILLGRINLIIPERWTFFNVIDKNIYSRNSFLPDFVRRR